MQGSRVYVDFLGLLPRTLVVVQSLSWRAIEGQGVRPSGLSCSTPPSLFHPGLFRPFFPLPFVAVAVLMLLLLLLLPVKPVWPKRANLSLYQSLVLDVSRRPTKIKIISSLELWNSDTRTILEPPGQPLGYLKYSAAHIIIDWFSAASPSSSCHLRMFLRFAYYDHDH